MWWGPAVRLQNYNRHAKQLPLKALNESLHTQQKQKNTWQAATFATADKDNNYHFLFLPCHVWLSSDLQYTSSLTGKPTLPVNSAKEVDQRAFLDFGWSKIHFLCICFKLGEIGSLSSHPTHLADFKSQHLVWTWTKNLEVQKHNAETRGD